jgi:hypothetical protein
MQYPKRCLAVAAVPLFLAGRFESVLEVGVRKRCDDSLRGFLTSQGRRYVLAQARLSRQLLYYGDSEEV